MNQKTETLDAIDDTLLSIRNSKHVTNTQHHIKILQLSLNDLKYMTDKQECAETLDLKGKEEDEFLELIIKNYLKMKKNL